MSLTTRVLIALVLGLAAGLFILAHPTPALLKLVSLVEPIGSLWVNAIRMTVVPLVVSVLITGVASSSNMRVVRGIGLRAIASFLGLLAFVAIFTTFQNHQLVRRRHRSQGCRGNSQRT
jgi:Na+/H+-dicarboxylate symporter